MDVKLDNSDVQAYLGMLQGVINRLAGNSASIKTWTVTLVSAILVVVIENSCIGYAWIALLPVIVFSFLDAYYVSLESDFRGVYNRFVQSLHAETLEQHQVYAMSLPCARWQRTTEALRAIASASVWPFYLLLGTAVVIIQTYL